MDKDYYIHSSSFIDDNVSIGNGTKIWHFCHIQSGSVIGKKLYSGTKCKYIKSCKNRKRC